MPFTETPLPGIIIFEPAVYPDERGFFFESYNKTTISMPTIFLTEFVQDNQSLFSLWRNSWTTLSTGTIYTVETSTGYWRVEFLDVVLDMRAGSPGFGKTYSILLSAENKKQIYVPKGFAHGFSVLSEKALITYKCDQFYNKQSEAGILYNDTALNIDWQIPSDKALVSPKDIHLPGFNPSVTEFIY